MRLFAVAFACTALGACHRDKHPVAQIEIVGATVDDNAVLGMGPPQVKRALESRLSRSGAFDVSGAAASPGALRMELGLELTRLARREGRPGVFAEVQATLTVHRRSADGEVRYELSGEGEAKVSGEGEGARQAAARKALGSALESAVAAAAAQLAALGKPDRELVQQLASKDELLRRYALRALAERKNPAAVSALVEQLGQDDPEEVHRAIGALVEIKDLRAVPPLIELAQGKDLALVREILFALAEIGGDEAEAYLYTMAQGHDQPSIRQAAGEAFDELQRRARSAAAAGAAATQQEVKQ